MQSLKGRAIDLLDVEPRAVDFREICEMLAGVNRHAGAAQHPVSVAAHTLIALDCAPDEVKPWVALHDMRAARLGEMPAPTRYALIELAGDLGGQFSEALRWALSELARRHDAAIHQAAGLAMPTQAQAQAIRIADLRAFATERRDFMSESPKRWSAEVERAQPATKVYRASSFGKCSFDVGETLYRRLEALLPALTGAR